MPVCMGPQTNEFSQHKNMGLDYKPCRHVLGNYTSRAISRHYMGWTKTQNTTWVMSYFTACLGSSMPHLSPLSFW